MKKLIFCLFMALLSCTSYAQVAREGNTFKSITTQTTKSGVVYINRKSAKTGKDYKQYLSKEVKEQIQKELNFKKS